MRPALFVPPPSLLRGRDMPHGAVRFLAASAGGMRCRHYNCGEGTGCRYLQPRHPMAPAGAAAPQSRTLFRREILRFAQDKLGAPSHGATSGRLRARLRPSCRGRISCGPRSFLPRAPMVWGPFAETKGPRRAGPKPRKNFSASVIPSNAKDLVSLVVAFVFRPPEPPHASLRSFCLSCPKVFSVNPVSLFLLLSVIPDPDRGSRVFILTNEKSKNPGSS